MQVLTNNGRSVAQFERDRPELTNFVKSEIVPLLDSGTCNKILVQAPVKSGKREMVEYIAMRDLAAVPTRFHVFVSSFHRVADESQRNELTKHNLTVFSLKGTKEVTKCHECMNTNLNQNRKIVLHIDECDFGSGNRQQLSRVYRAIRNNPLVTIIMYSATPQEVLFSGEVTSATDEDTEFQEMMDDFNLYGKAILYVPHETFCGPGKFLDAGLVTEATKFLDNNSLTIQGKSIIEGLKASCASGSRRNILKLRLSYNEGAGKSNKAIYQFINKVPYITELEGITILVDKDEKDVPNSDITLSQKIPWSSIAYWEDKQDRRPIILVVDQTCSRSTELACHNRLYAIHDFRPMVTFSTSSQALERVNHYIQRYGSFQPILVYGHKKTFEFSAGRISLVEYMEVAEWEKRKVDVRSGGGADTYKIRRSSGNHEIHPDYPNTMTEKQCDQILQQIGCFVKVSLSPRVSGDAYEEPVIKSKFYACNKDNFEERRDEFFRNNDDQIPDEIMTKYRRHRFRNPFIESERKGFIGGKYQGQLHNRWQVFDFTTQKNSEEGWRWDISLNSNPRLTICYDGDVLGIALRYSTGETIENNSLVTTNKSMYHR